VRPAVAAEAIDNDSRDDDGMLVFESRGQQRDQVALWVTAIDQHANRVDRVAPRVQVGSLPGASQEHIVDLVLVLVESRGTGRDGVVDAPRCAEIVFIPQLLP